MTICIFISLERYLDVWTQAAVAIGTNVTGFSGKYIWMVASNIGVGSNALISDEHVPFALSPTTVNTFTVDSVSVKLLQWTPLYDNATNLRLAPIFNDGGVFT